MTTKFTPGPWTLFKGSHVFYHGIEAEESKTSIVVWGSIDDDEAGVRGTEPHEEDATANAYLIAASPDLYAASAAAEDFLSTLEGNEALAIYNQLHSALVKARGG